MNYCTECGAHNPNPFHVHDVTSNTCWDVCRLCDKRYNIRTGHLDETPVYVSRESCAGQQDLTLSFAIRVF